MAWFLRKMQNAYHAFRNTLFEGHYNGHEHIDHLLKDEHPACSAEEQAGQRAFGLTVFIGGDVLLNVAYAFFSYATLGATAVITTIAGVAFYTHEFIRCRRLAKEGVTEVNLAGQHIMGVRGDLCRLHRAQNAIIDLTLEYNNAATEGLQHILQEKIEQTAASVAGEVSRVRVLDGGKYYPRSTAYQFEKVARHKQHLSLLHRRVHQQKKIASQTDLVLASMHHAAQS